MNTKAIVFDLDGTLADSLADIAAAGNHTLQQLGLKPRDVADYRQLAGQGLESLLLDAAGAEHVAAGEPIFKAYYADHFTDQTRPYPGVAKLLNDCIQRDIRIAVLSNKPDAFTQQVMQIVFGQWSFDIVRGHVEGTAVKPDPAGAFVVRDALGLQSSEIAYVGDTRADMLTGRAADFYAVGVTWGFRDRDELEASGAQGIVDHPDELLPLLDALR